MTQVIRNALTQVELRYDGLVGVGPEYTDNNRLRQMELEEIIRFKHTQMQWNVRTHSGIKWILVFTSKQCPMRHIIIPEREEERSKGPRSQRHLQNADRFVNANTT
jgi:hypothetical protein